MKLIYLRILLIAVNILFATMLSFAQHNVNGVIYDKQTGEPLIGAEVLIPNTTIGTITNSLGAFSIELKNNVAALEVRYVGYETTIIEDINESISLGLEESASSLDQVIVSANREKELRTEVPAAISAISPKVLEETNANTLDQVLNKIPGVFVADLANEQHMTSIRQPVSTKGLYLFLEDGLPTRPTGVFNHNAMNEMNQGAIRSIEIIRGPASSTYGAEAIGGAINIITQSPSLAPTGRIALRSNTNGMNRADFRFGNTIGKTGVFVGGYYSQRRDGFFEHSDMDKYAFTAKLTHAISNKTDINLSLTYADLDTDMTGSIDSVNFYEGKLESQQTFTERTVGALRVQSTLNHDWSDNSSTTARIFFRDNTIGQIPSYRVSSRPIDSQLLLDAGLSVDDSKAYHSGMINERTFKSYGGIIQHSLELPEAHSKIIGGVSVDYSPTDYFENFIFVERDTTTGFFENYTDIDSVLTLNQIDLFNVGSYITYQFAPIKKFKVSASLRYDRFRYDHDNFLTEEYYSGSPDAINVFDAVTPKIGFNYNFQRNSGLYTNFAQGFVPPQVGELYGGEDVPSLVPAVYNNYEVGGWYSFSISGELKGYTDVAFYMIDAANQIITVEDTVANISQNRNAGETKSKGIEYMLNLIYAKRLQFRWSGSFAKHEFVDYVEEGNVFNGNEMAHGSNVQYNWELIYRPSFANGLRISVENQHLGPYWMDNANTYQYDGFDTFNLRVGYKVKGLDLSVMVLNVEDEIWSPRGTYSYGRVTFTPGIPRTYQFGLAYTFGDK